MRRGSSRLREREPRIPDHGVRAGVHSRKRRALCAGLAGLTAVSAWLAPRAARRARAELLVLELMDTSVPWDLPEHALVHLAPECIPPLVRALADPGRQGDRAAGVLAAVGPHPENVARVSAAARPEQGHAGPSLRRLRATALLVEWGHQEHFASYLQCLSWRQQAYGGAYRDDDLWLERTLTWLLSVSVAAGADPITFAAVANTAPAVDARVRGIASAAVAAASVDRKGDAQR